MGPRRSARRRRHGATAGGGSSISRQTLVVQIECMHHGPVQIAFQVIQQFADPATKRAVVMAKTLSRFATDGWSSQFSGPTCTSVPGHGWLT